MHIKCIILHILGIILYILGMFLIILGIFIKFLIKTLIKISYITLTPIPLRGVLHIGT